MWGASAALPVTFACAEGDDYQSLTEAAVEEHSLGHYEEARALFARAHAIQPNARTLWGMGTAAFEARQYVDTIQLFQAALVDKRKPLTAEQRQRVEALLKRCANFVVRLRIRTQPENATLSVDGHTVEPDAQGIVLLDAGTHQVVASSSGYRETVRSIRWEAGEATLDVALEPRETKQPDSRVAPVLAEQGPSTRTQASQPSMELKPLSVLKWVALGATVASLGVAGAGYGLHEQAAKAWNDDQRCPPDKGASCPNIREAANRWRTMGIAGAASAGLFTVVTTVLFVVDRPKSKASERAATSCMPHGFGGLSCTVTY